MRNPVSECRYWGGAENRAADRQNTGGVRQDPPRRTRAVPEHAPHGSTTTEVE